MVIFECRRMDIKAINNLTEEQKLTREDYKNRKARDDAATSEE